MCGLSTCNPVVIEEIPVPFDDGSVGEGAVADDSTSVGSWAV